MSSRACSRIRSHSKRSSIAGSCCARPPPKTGVSSAAALQHSKRLTGDAAKDRCITQGVLARTRPAELHHQVQEVLGMVGLECDHELLIIEPKRVRRIQLHGREL